MRVGIAIGLIALGAGTPTRASSLFDGTWVADLDTQGGLGADTYLVAHGRYACRSCAPPRSYPADGKPHTILGDPDTLWESVTIGGPRTIVTHIVGPALDRTTTMTVAPDNRTATYVSIDHRPGVRSALRTEYLARRTARSPAGAHRISGTWQGVRYVAAPPQVRTEVLRVTGGNLVYRTPLGRYFLARMGGGYVVVHTPYGSPYFAAARTRGPRQIEERIRENGRVTAIRTFTVAADGRSMQITTRDARGDPTFRITARKQPPSGP